MNELEEGSPRLSAALGDKEEWKVKIYVDLKRRNCRISKTKHETKEEEFAGDEFDEKLNGYIEKSFGWMSKQACRAKLDEIPPKQSNQRKRAMVLNSTYLVSKEDRENLTRVVKFLWKDYKSKRLEYECTGPEPVTSFSSVK